MISDLVQKSRAVVAENSAAVLTGVSIVGTVTTAVLTGRASFKAAQLLIDIDGERWEASPLGEENDPKPMTTLQKTRHVGPLFLPAVGAGITTVTATFFGYQIASKKSAALAAAYGISEKAFQEYKDKVVEKLGEKKEDALRDEIAQDRVNNDPVKATQVMVIGGGDVLCYDSLNGRYFTSTMETLKKAENDVNRQILHESYASLGSFYDKIGLEPTEYSEEVGWNLNNLLDIKYSTTMSSDGRPCIVIDFQIKPVPRYDRVYGD